MVLVLGHINIWWVCMPSILVVLQQNLLINTWRHYISSIHSIKQSSHLFDELSIHSMLPRPIEYEWYTIFLYGEKSPDSQFLFSMQILFPWASPYACQVIHPIFICSFRPTCIQLVWFQMESVPTSMSHAWWEHHTPST